MESYWIMGWACVVCHGRWILTHCTTREVQQSNVFVVFQSLNIVRLFATPWTAAHQAPLSSTVSWSLLKFMSPELVMLSNHLTSVTPFSFCLQSCPASRSFPISWLFASGGQSIGASVSTSVSPTNIQSWFPLGFTGLISLQSKGLSEEKPKLEGVQSLLQPSKTPHELAPPTLLPTTSSLLTKHCWLPCGFSRVPRMLLATGPLCFLFTLECSFSYFRSALILSSQRDLWPSHRI